MTIKILQIIRGLDIGGDSGGAELFGVKLAKELNKDPNCDVRICAFYAVGTDTELKWQKDLQEMGIQTFFVSEWDGYNNMGKFLKGIRNLFNEIKDFKPDVAHSHFQLGTLAAVTLKLFNKTKTAYRTSHIRKEWNNGKWTWLLYPLFIQRIFPQYLDGEVGVSEAVCDYLRERRPEKIDAEKVHLIYNGIDIDQIKELESEPISSEDQAMFSEGKYIIGCVGRLAEQKGYPYLINAMEEIIKEYPNIILHIVGDGELRDELHQSVNSKGLTQNIIFLGLKNNVHSLIKNWDIFVLPSLWEGLPTVVMEAMIAQIPVIASSIPGTTELVIDHKTGILVPPRDVKALKNAIITLKHDPELCKFLVKNATTWVNQFGMQTISQNYIQLYKMNLELGS